MTDTRITSRARLFFTFTTRCYDRVRNVPPALKIKKHKGDLWSLEFRSITWSIFSDLTSCKGQSRFLLERHTQWQQLPTHSAHASFFITTFREVIYSDMSTRPFLLVSAVFDTLESASTFLRFSHIIPGCRFVTPSRAFREVFYK